MLVGEALLSRSLRICFFPGAGRGPEIAVDQIRTSSKKRLRTRSTSYPLQTPPSYYGDVRGIIEAAVDPVAWQATRSLELVKTALF